MLQENAITGLLFVLGIGLNSPTMLLGGILATVSALVIAKLCRYNLTAVQSGLYGFNAALVGIAVFYFLPVSPISLTFAILGGALSALLMQFMITKLTCTPALTTPFILTTWLMLVLIDYAGLSTIVHSSFSDVNSVTLVDYFLAILRGVGQVMLQDYWFSGVIFLCALAFNSIQIAVWAVFGSAAGLLLAFVFSFSVEQSLMGIYGFNSCLVAVAVAGRYPKKYWLIMLATLISVLLTRAFELFSLPTLTAPFVLTTWLMISLVKIKHNSIETSSEESGYL